MRSPYSTSNDGFRQQRRLLNSVSPNKKTTPKALASAPSGSLALRSGDWTLEIADVLNECMFRIYLNTTRSRDRR